MNDLWDKYKRDGDLQTRNELLIHYMPVVKYVAQRVGQGLPSNVEHNDLVSYGIFGLVDAIDKFDPGRGFKFETYAIPRIKGSILDELRAIDWVPRSTRAKARAIENARDNHDLNRLRTDHEVAVELGYSTDQFAAVMTEVSMTQIHSLDSRIEFRDSAGIDQAEMVADTTAIPEDVVTLDALAKAVADAVNKLPERERIVITLYYYEGKTLAEIGQILGVTESRVCQIHTKACKGVKVHV